MPARSGSLGASQPRRSGGATRRVTARSWRGASWQARRTPAGAPIERAGLFAIQAELHPASVDELRDGSLLPLTDHGIPVFMRPVEHGVGTIDDMYPGLHTVCVVLGNPQDPTTVPKLHCELLTLSAATKQAFAITVTE